MDCLYAQVDRDLQDRRQQASENFTAERLRSFYIRNRTITRPAVEAVHEAKALLDARRWSPSLVFSATAFELLLKAILLRPVVYGLVRQEALAELLLQRIVGKQTDIARYEEILAGVVETVAGIDLAAISRDGRTKPLMIEAKEFQKQRDGILHQGARCSSRQARTAWLVAVAMNEMVVAPMLAALGLTVGKAGEIERIDWQIAHRRAAQATKDLMERGFAGPQDGMIGSGLAALASRFN